MGNLSRFWVLLSFTFFILSVNAQFINGNNQDFAGGLFLYACAGSDTLLDDGGATADYSEGQNLSMTICPDVGTQYMGFEVVQSSFGTGDLLCFYDGNSQAAPVLACLDATSSVGAGDLIIASVANVDNGCVTLGFVSDNDGAVGNFSLRLICTAPCQAVEIDTVTTIPAPGADGYINVLLGEEICFTGSGEYPQNGQFYTQDDASSLFVWDFGDGVVDTGQTVCHTYTNSSIFIPTLTIVDNNNCQNLTTGIIGGSGSGGATAALKVRVFPLPDVTFTGNDDVLCLGDTGIYEIFVNGEPILDAGVLVGDTIFSTNETIVVDTVVFNEDQGTAGDGMGAATIYPITISGYGPGETIQNPSDINVCMFLEHSWVGDIDMIVRCPNGQETYLFDMNPPASPNIDFGTPAAPGVLGVPEWYCWNSAATNPPLDDNSGPLFPSGMITPGDYQISGDWNDLSGCPINGTWYIIGYDDWPGMWGFTHSYSLSFNESYLLEQDTFPIVYQSGAWMPDGSIINSNSEQVEVVPDTVGVYTYEYTFTDNAGNQYTEEFSLEVAGFDIDLTPADTSICAGDEVQLNVTTSIPEAPDCAASPVSCAAINTVDVGNPSGTGTATNSPFYWGYDDIRLQILYTAADLNAMGFTGGIIDAIAFDITAKNSNIPFENYTVKMACTDLTAIGNDFESAAFVDVVTLATYNTQLGWSELPFTTPYVWDGVSNLIIELCNDNFNGSWIPGDSDAIRVTNNVGYQAVAFNRADNSDGCSLTNAGFGFNVSTNRPNIRFSYCDANPDVVWTPSMDLSDSTSLNPIATPMVDTDYIATITDGHGCSYSDTASIDVASDFAYTLTPNTSVCEGGSIQLSATGADTYVWTPDDGTLDDNMISDPTATPVDNTLYYIELTLDGCSTTDSVEVLVNPIPQAEINNGNTQETICDGASVLLFTADNPGWSYSWTGPQTGMGASLQATMAGTYNLVFSDGTCFGMPQSIIVHPNPIPQLDFTDLRTILCCNDEVIFNAANFADIEIDEIIWDGSPQDLQDVMIFSGDQGVHTISVLSNGCESAEVNLMFENKCIEGISINHPAEVFANAPTEVTASYQVGEPGNFTYDWTAASLFDGSTDSVAIFTAGEGVYDVMVVLTEDFTLNNGESHSCPATADGQITVIYVGDPDIANAFSPNGDGLNDFFRPLNVDGHSMVKNFRVYNRWGELMYEHDGLDQGWDGMFKGELQPQGVYTYYIEVEKPGSEVFFEQGTFTLLK